MLDDGGKHFEQDEAAKRVGDVPGDWWQIRESTDFGLPMQTAWSRRLHDQNRPVLRERNSGQKRWDAGFPCSAAIDDQSAVLEAIQADPRPMAAPVRRASSSTAGSVTPANLKTARAAARQT